MIWRTAFVVVLISLLTVACQDRQRIPCPDVVASSTTYRTKNKAPGVDLLSPLGAQNMTPEQRGKC
jgi:hypothetical protein